MLLLHFQFVFVLSSNVCFQPRGSLLPMYLPSPSHLPPSHCLFHHRHSVRGSLGSPVLLGEVSRYLEQNQTQQPLLAPLNQRPSVLDFKDSKQTKKLPQTPQLPKQVDICIRCTWTLKRREILSHNMQNLCLSMYSFITLKKPSLFWCTNWKNTPLWKSMML